jgi:hypothetical protein
MIPFTRAHLNSRSPKHPMHPSVYLKSIFAIDAALQSIRTGAAPKLNDWIALANITGKWQRTALWHYELDELRHFIDLHSFQLRSLSRSELETALNRATAKIKSEGCVVEVVRDVQAFGQQLQAA